MLPQATVTLLNDAVGASAVKSNNEVFFTAAATNPTTKTGSDGKYKFADVTAGNYVVKASASLAGFNAGWDTDGNLDWTVAVAVASQDATADFAGTGAGSIAGTVTDQLTGTPISSAELQCTWFGIDGVAGTDDDVAFKTTAGGDGSYVVDGVPYGSFACTATDPKSGRQQSATAHVVSMTVSKTDVVLPSHASLAATGFDSKRWLWISIELLLTGVTLQLAARRGRRT